MKILAFAAFLRAASLNRKLIQQAVTILRAAPGVDLDLADFREFDMSMYDGDQEARDGIPAGGSEFIRRNEAPRSKLRGITEHSFEDFSETKLNPVASYGECSSSSG